MTGLSELANFIGNGIVNLIFGNVLLAGIFIMIFMMVLFWKFGVSRDGAVVVIVPLFLLLAGYQFLPQAISIIVWFMIGIMMFLIFVKLFER